MGAGVDRRAYLHRYDPRALEKGLAAPEQSGIVRDRHHRNAAFHGEPGPAHMILAALAGSDPRAFGEDRNPETLREALMAEFRHAPERPGAAAAVDGDRAHQCKTPSEERNPQELALQYQYLRRENHLECERFPRRLVLGENHRGRARQVLNADHTIIDAEHGF